MDLLPKGSISVLDHGARPGAADNTAAFILAFAIAASSGATVYVPPHPSGYVVGPVRLHSSMRSEGARLIRKSGTNGPWFKIRDSEIEVRGFIFDGNDQTQVCFDVDGAEATDISDNSFLDVHDYTCKFNGVSRFRYANNRHFGVWNGVTNVMPEDSAAAALSNDIKILANTFVNVAGSAVYVSGKRAAANPNHWMANPLASDLVVSDNILVGVDGHGLLLQARTLAVKGNTLTAVGASAGLQSIVCQADDVSVTGNIVNGGYGVGIDMGRCRRGSVSGNTVTGAGEIGIEAQSCLNLSISGNTVSGCGWNNLGTSSACIALAQGFFDQPGETHPCDGITVGINQCSGVAGKYAISIGAGVTNYNVSSNQMVGAGSVARIYRDSAAGDGLIAGNFEDAAESDVFKIMGAGKVVPTGANAHAWLISQGSGVIKRNAYFANMSDPANFVPDVCQLWQDDAGNVFGSPLMYFGTARGTWAP